MEEEAEDKKENINMKIVKKGLVLAGIQYAVLKFTNHQCFAHAQLKLCNHTFPFMRRELETKLERIN